MFDTIKDSAARQLSGRRGSIFFIGLQGIDGSELKSSAGQDNDPTQPATAIRLGVSRFVSGAGRDQVIGVGFLSETGLRPVQDGLIDSGGNANYFPKRENPFWSKNFSGLFAWQS